MLQWLGGIGIIVVAVAVLPMLGIGGMQLYKAETPGPSKDSKLTPRITETAKALVIVYVALTLACAAAYYVAGMSGFDAIAHAFSTVAIGGFSTHDASMGYFEERYLAWSAACLWSFPRSISACTFWPGGGARHSVYAKDSETRFFSACCTGLCSSHLLPT